MGAVTWGNGLTGTSGVVSSSNSLIGSTTNDTVGGGGGGCVCGVVALSNGNYVVASPLWERVGGPTDAGAVTWGNGLTGSTGAVSTLNSLTGSATYDTVGGGGVVALSNGNYVVSSPLWDLDGGPTDVGAVTWGNGLTGTSGVVSSSNSLIGSTSYDTVGGGGFNGVVSLSNGNYVVCSPLWDLDGSHTNVGAITLGNGLTGSTGPVTALNSVLGTTSGGGGWGLVYGFDYVHYQLVVGRPGDNTVTWMTVPVLPPTGANTNAFVAAALVFLAVGTVLVATRRRGPRAI
uniref:Unannotated protein n=1 Tax=freshwater metagenome TaxID=449393 RepID=A0A6J7NCY0_9ZZZZ